MGIIQCKGALIGSAVWLWLKVQPISAYAITNSATLKQPSPLLFISDAQFWHFSIFSLKCYQRSEDHEYIKDINKKQIIKNMLNQITIPPSKKEHIGSTVLHMMHQYQCHVFLQFCSCKFQQQELQPTAVM